MATAEQLPRGEAVSPQGLTPDMQRAVLAAAGLILLMLVLFYDSAASMVRVWANSSTFGHGFLIPPIVAYLVWIRRNSLAGLDPRPSFLGVAWTAGAALVWLLGQLAHANLLQHLALVGLMQGVVLAALGFEAFKRLMFPLGYMLFMVPFGDFAIRPLQGFTAEHTTTLVRLSGIPVLLENWIITIPGGSFLVAEACAGVRFLIASIALGVLISGEFFETWWKRLFFVALSIVVPIGANVVRAYGIVMIAHWSNFELAVGVDHLVYGFVFLSFVMGILIAIAYFMRDARGEDGQGGRAGKSPGTAVHMRPMGGVKLAVMPLLVVAIAVAARVYEARISSPAGGDIAALRAPIVGDAWEPLPTPSSRAVWRGRFPKADAERLWRFRAPSGSDLSLYIAYFADEGKDKELVSYANRLTPSDTVDVIRAGRLKNWALDGLPPPAYRILSERGKTRIVWFWYCMDGEVVADRMAAKLLGLRKKLFGGQVPGAVIAVSAVAESPSETAALERFLNASDLIERMQQQGLRRLVIRDDTGRAEGSF